MNREFSEPRSFPNPNSQVAVAGRQAGRQRGSEWRTQASGPRPAENSRLYSQWTAQLTTNPGLQLGQSLNLNRPIEPLNRQTVQPSAILRRYRFPPPATEFLREQ